MEIRQLKYFINAARTLNFTEAAKLSFVAQSTLSQQIKQLETELDTQLFERVGKRVALTEEGRVFLPIAQKTVNDAADGEQQLRDMAELKSGRLRIGIAYGLSTAIIDTITEYNRQYPGIFMEIHYEKPRDLVKMLHERVIDFAIAYNILIADEEIQEEPLFASRLSAVMKEHHPLSQSRGSISLDQLQRYPTIVTAEGMNARLTLDAYAKQQGITFAPSIEINEIFTLLRLVKTGRWIGIVSDAVTVGERGITTIPLADGNIPMQVSVLNLRSAYLPKAAATFLANLHENVGRALWGKEKKCEVCGETFLLQ